MKVLWKNVLEVTFLPLYFSCFSFDKKTLFYLLAITNLSLINTITIEEITLLIKI